MKPASKEVKEWINRYWPSLLAWAMYWVDCVAPIGLLVSLVLYWGFNKKTRLGWHFLFAVGIGWTLTGLFQAGGLYVPSKTFHLIMAVVSLVVLAVFPARLEPRKK